MVNDLSNGTVTPHPGVRFGQRLREQRERHGVTLDAIAACGEMLYSRIVAAARTQAVPAGSLARTPSRSVL